jgi:hypothetical protein
LRAPELSGVPEELPVIRERKSEQPHGLAVMTGHHRSLVARGTDIKLRSPTALALRSFFFFLI